MAHLLLVLHAVVREHVHDEHASARRQDASGLRQDARRIRLVVQDQRQHGHVDRRIVERQVLERALAHVHVRSPLETPPRRCQHLRRAVDGHHAQHERRERIRQFARSAAEVADDPALVRQGDERLRAHAMAEQLAPQPIPLVRRGREERLGLGAPPIEDAPEPPLVLLRAGCPGHLIPDDRPQTARALVRPVTGHAVVAAGPVPPRHHPPAVGQRLEVPADGGLRQLQYCADLRHRELVPLDAHEHAHADRVREDSQVVENRGSRLIHPFIRM